MKMKNIFQYGVIIFLMQLKITYTATTIRTTFSTTTTIPTASVTRSATYYYTSPTPTTIATTIATTFTTIATTSATRSELDGYCEGEIWNMEIIYVMFYSIVNNDSFNSNKTYSLLECIFGCLIVLKNISLFSQIFVEDIMSLNYMHGALSSYILRQNAKTDAVLVLSIKQLITLTNWKS